jgi:Ca2+-binding RTX toxin-like protein
MSLNIIARKDYEDLQKNILNEKEQVILMWRLFPFSFISNAGDDILKDISGGNDIYKFKKGDGADTIYDIKGNDTIIFDESVLKEDITFSQSEDLKSLIINYSATDSITITNYFDSFSKIENIQLSTSEKLTPEFTTQTIGSNQAENLITGYGNDTISSNQGDDTIKDLNGNDTYTFKVGDGNDIIEDLDGIDKIVFENLSNEDLIFTQKDNNLVIHYSINDSVTILNYFDNTTSNYLEKIAFKNDLETIDASNIITGTINDDEINGTYFDDVITSNKGNDTLKGFYGNDTYKFSKGDGNNRIYDVKGDDTITFDETINKEDISFIIKDNNLLITIFEYEKSVA